ncbi:MAG: FHA domain-containing protein [Lentisphaerae bacterium]|nr:FHA domain-containing protein [Lentisphaerota bacterium]
MADYPRLMVLSEKFRGLVFELKQDSMSVGRNDQRDICIKDPSLSSYHCDFIHTEEGYFVCDRDSTNGTRLNNVPVEADMMMPLKNSDLLQLGSVEVMFEFDDGSAPSVSRTETGIDLTSTQTGMSTVKDFGNLSPFASNDTKNEARNRKLVVGALIASGLLIAGLLVWVLISMVKNLL